LFKCYRVRHQNTQPFLLKQPQCNKLIIHDVRLIKLAVKSNKVQTSVEPSFTNKCYFTYSELQTKAHVVYNKGKPISVLLHSYLRSCEKTNSFLVCYLFTIRNKITFTSLIFLALH